MSEREGHPLIGRTALYLTRLAHLPQTLGAKLDRMGGFLRCNTCMRTIPMKGAAEYLQRGWPKCHEATMEWVSARPPSEGTPGPTPRKRP